MNKILGRTFGTYKPNMENKMMTYIIPKIFQIGGMKNGFVIYNEESIIEQISYVMELDYSNLTQKFSTYKELFLPYTNLLNYLANNKFIKVKNEIGKDIYINEFFI